MDRSITATDANREFSRMLGEVADGASYVVTSRGKPVARVTPFREQPVSDDDRKAKLRALLAEMRAMPLRHAGRITRDDGYE